MAGVLLIGCGRWGQRYADALQRRGELAGIATKTVAGASRAAARYQVPTDRSPAALYARLDAEGRAPSALAVLSPTRAHPAHALLGLGLRLPTLVIKPLAATPARCRALGEAFAAAGVPLLVGHETVWNPALIAIWRAAQQGAIGELQALEVLRQEPDDAGAPGDPSTADIEAAGRHYGWLYDTLIHEAALIHALGGTERCQDFEVDEVFASSSAPRLLARCRLGALAVQVRYTSAAGQPFGYEVALRGESGSLRMRAGPGFATAELSTPGAGSRPLPRTAAASGRPEDALVAELLATCAAPAADAVGPATSAEVSALALDTARRWTITAQRCAARSSQRT